MRNWLSCAALALLVAAGGCRGLRGRSGAEPPPRPKGPVEIVLRNPLDRAVYHAPVFIRARRLPAGEFYIIDPKGASEGFPKAEVVCQVDDLNHDGQSDEVFFQIDMGPGETRRLRLVPGPLGRVPERATRAFIYRDPSTPVTRAVLESALAGYYTYGATKLGVFGKTRPKLTADKLFAAGRGRQHEWSAELGMDYMPIGLSMGAGAIGLSEYRKDRPRISRPWTRNSFFADKLQALKRLRGTRYAYHVTADGPLRAIIDTRIGNWRTDQGTYALTVRQMVLANRRCLRWTVWFDKVDTRARGLLFGVGFRKLKEEAGVWTGDSYLASASRRVYEPVAKRIVAGWLGLGLIFSPADRKETLDTPADGGNRIALLDVIGKGRVTFHTVAAWDRDGGILSAEGWHGYVKALAEELNNPIQVVSVTPCEK